MSETLDVIIALTKRVELLEAKLVAQALLARQLCRLVEAKLGELERQQNQILAVVMSESTASPMKH